MNPVPISFLDTNVLVYAYDRADPRKHAAALALLAAGDPDEFVISSQVLGEFFTVVTRKLATPLAFPEAVSAVRALANLTVLPVDASLVGEALDLLGQNQLSYWDGLIIAAAGRAGCARVLTEDLRSGSTIGGVRIENPFAASDDPGHEAPG